MTSADPSPPRGDDSLIIVMRPDATAQDVEQVIERLRQIVEHDLQAVKPAAEKHLTETVS